MNVNFVLFVPFDSCKSLFQTRLQDKNKLPQIQHLNELVSKLAGDSTNHNMIELIINDEYCSLDELRYNIVAASHKAQKYFYLAVNKFLVYSTQDISVTDSDYDLRLIKYCQDAISDTFTLLEYTVRPDDDGSLGNFVHPVTTMLFKRND